MHNDVAGTVHASTLKGKINGLEETVRVLTDELLFYKNEISNLKDEKNTLESTIAKKTNEIRTTLTTEVQQAGDNLRNNWSAQKQECLKM